MVVNVLEVSKEFEIWLADGRREKGQEEAVPFVEARPENRSEDAREGHHDEEHHRKPLDEEIVEDFANRNHERAEQLCDAQVVGASQPCKERGDTGSGVQVSTSCYTNRAITW